MTEFSKSEKRLIARVAGINVTRLKRWSSVAGAISIFLAVVDLVLPYVDQNHPCQFWRMMFLASFGGMLLETPRLYGLIQKLLQPGQGETTEGKKDQTEPEA